MALEGVDQTLFQLKDKETADDVELDRQQLEQNGAEHCAMTTRKEIISWWLYDCGSSAQMGVGLAFIFPIFLSLMSGRYACLNHTPYGCDWDGNPINSDQILRVSFGSIQLKPESYASAMLSISSAFQAVAYILCSALADYGTYKIYLFRITAIITQLMYMTWIFFANEDVWLFAGLWGALSTIPFGLSVIFYNAYLLELVENHWRIRRLKHYPSASSPASAVQLVRRTSEEDRTKDVALASDTTESVEKETKKKLMTTIQDDISEWGFACGYCGSTIATILIVAILFITDDTNTGFTDPVGVNDKEVDPLNNNHNWLYEYTVDTQTQFDELNVLRVIDAHVWYSILTLYESGTEIDRFSLTNGIQFIYDCECDVDRLNGDIFGSNDTLNNIVHDGVNYSYIDIQSYHGILGDIGDIKTFNVYLNDVGLVNAIQFNADGTIFGVINNTELIENTYDEFFLGGYEVTVSTLDMNFHDELRDLDAFQINKIDVISGFNSIAFVASDGRYGSLFSFQLSYFLVGVWFFIFSLPAFMNLKKRVRPPIPPGSSVWTISVKSYWKVAKQATSYPDLFKYLIVWFLFSDALYTTGSCAILFAQVELGMSSMQLVLVLLEVDFIAVPGAFLFVWLQKKMKWNAKQMLLLHLFVMALIPLYAVFGVIKGSPFGLVSVWEMYAICAIYGLNQGSQQALSRSLFGNLIPSGMESEFFGLYEITDKGSSWLGPMVMAIVSNFTSMRYALIYIVIFYVISIPLLYYGVDYERGVTRAKESTEETTNQEIR